MLNTLEREVFEKFQQLEPDAKQRVLALIEQETTIEAEQPDAAAFDYDSWWAEVEVLQAEIRGRIGKSGTIGALSLLDELREESS